MGFSLPLDERGLPKTDSYIASSAKKIRQFILGNEKAGYAYVIMAQPLSESAPSYCLSIYSTNNKFTFREVMQRWKYMIEEAETFDIKIMGFSSDGDTRLLKSMRLASKLSNSSVSSSWEWYHIDELNFRGCSFVQDSVHIATKLRTRFLKYSVVIPLGKYLASVSHLQIVIQEFSKEKHLLCPSDLKPEDKMNFRSAEKMYSEKVRQFLKSVPLSEGTEAYLRIMQYSVTAYLDKDMEIHTRIYKICIKDILDRINRISYINLILNDLNNEFVFPREQKNRNSTNLDNIADLTDESIASTVHKALSDALICSTNLGMTVSPDSWLQVKLSDRANEEILNIEQDNLEDNEIEIEDLNVKTTESKYSIDNVIQNVLQATDIDNLDSEKDRFEDILDMSEIAAIRGDLQLKDFPEYKSTISNNSPFVEVIVEGKIRVLKKSSLCWLFDQTGRTTVIDINLISLAKIYGDMAYTATRYRIIHEAPAVTVPSVVPSDGTQSSGVMRSLRMVDLTGLDGDTGHGGTDTDFSGGSVREK
ncbi:unnamed protein product [Phaedon cochleariae]|uniref:Uncharacterized protein n=1 Tax=Phaedon cochleariae TaxID=80249 RepID=A0A9N9X0K2_PHACE|nr:unnamed protein product [Phaedon cochleariae]